MDERLQRAEQLLATIGFRRRRPQGLGTPSSSSSTTTTATAATTTTPTLSTGFTACTSTCINFRSFGSRDVLQEGWLQGPESQETGLFAEAKESTRVEA